MKRFILLFIVLFVAIGYAPPVGKPVGSGATVLWKAYVDTIVGVRDTVYSDTFRLITGDLTGTASVTWGIDNRDDDATNDYFLWVQSTDDPSIGWFNATMIDSIKDAAADDTTSSKCSWDMKTARYKQYYVDVFVTATDTVYVYYNVWFKAKR